MTRSGSFMPTGSTSRPLHRDEVGRGERDRERVTERAAVPQPLVRAGLFWSAEGMAAPTGPFDSSGRHVAAAEWTRAVARHGSISTVDIFAPIAELDRCQELFRDMPQHLFGAPTALARLFPDSAIPARLQAHSYQVLHDPTGLHLTRLSYVRSRLSDRIFPVTCSQYGISYSFRICTELIPMLTAPTYPCDSIVCPTHASRRALENRLADLTERYARAWDRPAPRLPRFEVIPWGVDMQRFAPRDQVLARRDLHLPLDRPILLCLGRVRIQDKMDWTPLLLAFQSVCRMSKERPLFVLAGSAPSAYSEQVVAQAAGLGLREDLVTFFNLPPASLPTLYAACDLFVAPTDSPSESFGLTIVEAMACGRPVVASDWDGYKELIVHGETGFKVRTDWADCLHEVNEMAPFLSWEQEHLHVGQSVSVDVAQMAGYLTQLLGNRELREEMGQRARARAMELYDWPAVIAQWEALWGELAAVAQQIEGREPDRLVYLQPNYFQQFRHYASRIIDDSVPVQLTERGKELLAGKAPLLLHPWARGFLHPEYLLATLAALKPAGWMRASLQVGDVVKALHQIRGLSRDQALMHLMWLAKYDLVSLLGGQGDEGRAPR